MKKTIVISFYKYLIQTRKFIALVILLLCFCNFNSYSENNISENKDLSKSFLSPPSSFRPCVFWDWLGGMVSKEGITKDLEALAEQGVGGVMVMQMPDQFPYPYRWDFCDYPGKVEVLSDEWFDLVNYALKESHRLGLKFSMFICPGWSHAGGPWINSRRGLKKLVFSEIKIEGPIMLQKMLERAPRSKGIGGGNEIPVWFSSDKFQEKERLPDFYQDVAVLAIPSGNNISAEDIIDLTERMDSSGNISWNVPSGSWRILRFGVASENGVNHPAPIEGTGLECDRMDPEAVRMVFQGMIDRIIREAGDKGYHSFKAFETDSYEAGFQDFGLDYQEEFIKRRRYDCTPLLPAWMDKDLIIETKELTERFRYDMKVTISEITSERFHGKLRSLADEYNVEWMIEPYFMLELDWKMMGAQSKLPGSEFWIGKPFYLIGPAPDIASLYGLQVVWAESFTAESYNSAWRNDPYILKPWGDAAFARGINQIYMHGFVHNPFGDNLQPGFSMGYWGTQFNRHLTWWPFSSPWHLYLSRCQYLLQQGRPVDDVLVYPSKIQSIATNAIDAGPYRQVVLDDNSLFNRLRVGNDGTIEVEGGSRLKAIALTPGLALTPKSLKKIYELVLDGATLIGEVPPLHSSSLENYPNCDLELEKMIHEIWGTELNDNIKEKRIGKGRLWITSKFIDALDQITAGPDIRFYDKLGKNNIWVSKEEPKPNIFDFQVVESPEVQVNAISDKSFAAMDFVHRKVEETDIYFVCNTGKDAFDIIGDFRIQGRIPEIWDPVTGKMEKSQDWLQEDDRTKIKMHFASQQSYFVVFREHTSEKSCGNLLKGFPTCKNVKTLNGPWTVSFDPRWGGPQQVIFEKLTDWSLHHSEYIKYYSGKATYQKYFDVPAVPDSKIYIDLGEVHDLAKVRLNGEDLGIVWCDPWRLEVPLGMLKKKDNVIEIEIVNTWVNRLIGDEQEPEDCELIEWNPDYRRKGSYDINIDSRALKDLPDWVVNNKERPSKGRYTFVNWRFYDKNAPLRSSGLLGPVKLMIKQ